MSSWKVDKHCRRLESCHQNILRYNISLYFNILYHPVMCLCVVEYGRLPRRSEMPLKEERGDKSFWWLSKAFRNIQSLRLPPLLLLNSSKSTFNAIRWVAFAFCIGTEKSKPTLQKQVSCSYNILLLILLIGPNMCYFVANLRSVAISAFVQCLKRRKGS